MVDVIKATIRNFFFVCGAIFLCGGNSFLLAEQWEGKVVHIVDGDTFDVLRNDNAKVRIRLAEIDTPERGKPWSKKATEALKALIAGEKVKVEVSSRDRYSRLVATVWVGDIDVNKWMVRNGHARVYRRYMKRANLLDVEGEARANQRGFWGLPEEERATMWLRKKR